MSNFENIDEDLLKKLQKYDISLNEALQTGISQIVDAQEYDRIPNKIPREILREIESTLSDGVKTKRFCIYNDRIDIYIYEKNSAIIFGIYVKYPKYIDTDDFKQNLSDMDCNISKIGEEYQAIIEDKTDYIPKFELDELKIPDSPFDRSGVRYESTHQI